MFAPLLQSAKKTVLHGLLEQLEGQNSVPEPTASLQLVEGDWKLLYSTITITVRAIPTVAATCIAFAVDWP